MALQDHIRELVATGRLPRQWTAADLKNDASLCAVYSETYLATHPANRSKPVLGMDDLDTGAHVRNGLTALFLRVGRRDGALLFQLTDASLSETGGLRFPDNVSLAASDADIEESADEFADPRDETITYTTVTEENNWIEDGDRYLSSDAAIAELVEDLRGILGDGPPVSHCYRHRRPAYDWQCLGLLEAAARYRFPVRNYKYYHALIGPPPRDTLAANAAILNHLKTTLFSARITGNEPLAVQTAIDILEWGGTNRGHYNENAVRAASTRPGGFLGYLDLCERSFGTGTYVSLTPFIGSGHAVRSNAGFTKIYSLVFDDFIIYDSRVAAALGLIIVRTLALRGHRHTAVPASVAFRADNQGHFAQQRNPNSNAFKLTGFPLAAGNHHLEHLKWNIRANALLTHVLAGSSFEKAVLTDPVRFPVQPLRALEAALFMIGYDLGANWPHHN